MNATEKGITLIEASAGTGKTYTLCRQVLHLIAVRDISIDRILIVTFTKAATEELRERIRALLRASIKQVSSGELIEDALIDAINSGVSDNELIERLHLSIDLFDEASISTIHGFCKRALEQCSLESGASMDSELITVESQIIERIRNEFIRRRLFEDSPIIAAAFSQGTEIANLLDQIGRLVANAPAAIVQPDNEPPAAAYLSNAFENALEELSKLRNVRSNLNATLKGRTKFQSALNSDVFEARLQLLNKRGFPLPADLNWIQLFSAENLGKALKKNADPTPFSRLVETVGNFSQGLTSYRNGIANEYRTWLYEQLSDYKRRENALSFNDLLHQLDQALSSEKGDRLTSSIASLFDAAFIDEFQDTDPTQYQILSRIFGQGDHYLTLIGDPKQAIYRFRGADIFAYFAAAERADNRLELHTNYRSKRELVSSVNQLFGNAVEGFAYQEIKYNDISPSPKALEAPIGGTFRFLINEAPNGQFHNTTEKTDSIVSASVSEIQALAKNFAPEDIAVLVNENKQADQIKKRLNKAGIESLIIGERSIFECEEAEAFEQLLRALSRPNKIAYARAALLTPIFGYSLSDFEENDAIEVILENLTQALSDWNRHWDDSLSFRLQGLFKLLKVEDRLFDSPNGETVFSNTRHLADLLDEEKKRRSLGPTGLLTWLQRKRLARESPDEASRTRLGSDQGKVRLITIHKSKGLQFKCVLCPFLNLDRSSKITGAHLYHDPERGNRSVLNLAIDSDANAVSLASREMLAERIRLFYVALTRAEEHCSVILAQEESKGRGEPSAFSKFLLGRDSAQALFKNKNLTNAIEERLEQLELSVHRIAASEEPIPNHPEPFENVLKETAKPRAFTIPSIPNPLQAASFSSIVRNGTHSSEIDLQSERLIEETTPIDSIDDETSSISHAHDNLFDLPKGVETGELLHLLLEQADFSAKSPFKIIDLSHSPRQQVLFAKSENATIKGLQSVLEKPLPTPFDEPFPLRSITTSQRLNEVEFAFTTSATGIQSLLRRVAAEVEFPDEWRRKIAETEYPFSAAILRGFIDLLFEHQGRYYLLDWKSNHLGENAADYDQANLSEAMAAHDYFLQLLLYTVALKRYLAVRRPQQSFSELFGGAYYIFLRGAQLPGADGIYYLNPNPQLIEDLDTTLDRTANERQ